MLRALPAALLLAWLPTASLAQVAPTPSAWLDGIRGDALHWRGQDASPDEAALRVIALPDGDTPGQLAEIPADLSAATSLLITNLDPANRTFASVAAVAAGTGLTSYATDPASGLVWEIEGGVDDDEASMVVLFDAFLIPESGQSVPLCSPVGLAAGAIGEEHRIVLAEGSPANSTPPWGDFACPPRDGGLLVSAGSLADFVVGGDGEARGELPLPAAKALTVRGDRLAAVAAPSIPGGPARVLLWTFGADAYDLVDAWSISPRIGAQLGSSPSRIALLDGAVAVGGTDGLVLLDLAGNELGPIWSPTFSSPETEDATSLLGLASTPTGDALYALFDQGDPGDRLLVRWDLDDLPQPQELTLCVQADQPGEACLEAPKLPEGCAWLCASVQAAVERAPHGATIRLHEGALHESVLVDGRSLTLRAAVEGRTHWSAKSTALTVRYNGPPGVTVDGVVFAGEANGALAILEGDVRLERSVLHGHRAERGAGIAAVGARHLSLDQCGLFDNEAAEGSALASAGSPMQPELLLALSFVTLEGEDALLLDDTELAVHSTILAGERALSLRDGATLSGSLDHSLVWPEDAWRTHPPKGEPSPLDLPGDANLAGLDPAFVPEPLDYHLGDDSPARGAGRPDPPDDAPDMGMYAQDWDWDRPSIDDDDSADDDDTDNPQDDDDTDSNIALLPPPEAFPPGLRCECRAAPGGAPMLLLLAFSRRRRRAAPGDGSGPRRSD